MESVFTYNTVPEYNKSTQCSISGTITEPQSTCHLGLNPPNLVNCCKWLIHLRWWCAVYSHVCSELQLVLETLSFISSQVAFKWHYIHLFQSTTYKYILSWTGVTNVEDGCAVSYIHHQILSTVLSICQWLFLKINFSTSNDFQCFKAVDTFVVV